MDVLYTAPGAETHNYYQNLSRLNLKDLTDEIISKTDSFWSTFKTFDRDDRSDAKCKLLRDYLLDLEILDKIHGRSHRAAEAEIRDNMEKNEITVLPLGQDRCAVRYITHVGNRQTRTRTLPLPHNLMRSFQRYGRLGERPMTKGEFETQYRRLVDPNTKLQF